MLPPHLPPTLAAEAPSVRPADEDPVMHVVGTPGTRTGRVYTPKGLDESGTLQRADSNRPSFMDSKSWADTKRCPQVRLDLVNDQLRALGKDPWIRLYTPAELRSKWSVRWRDLPPHPPLDGPVPASKSRLATLVRADSPHLSDSEHERDPEARVEHEARHT